MKKQLQETKAHFKEKIGSGDGIGVIQRKKRNLSGKWSSKNILAEAMYKAWPRLTKTKTLSTEDYSLIIGQVWSKQVSKKWSHEQLSEALYKLLQENQSHWKRLQQTQSVMLALQSLNSLMISEEHPS